MNKLFDLRFVIGLFFAVIGMLLLLYTLVVDKGNTEKINIVGGLLFTLFGLAMIFLSNRKDEAGHTH